jgi:hypothetical protein
MKLGYLKSAELVQVDLVVMDSNWLSAKDIILKKIGLFI